MTLQPSQSQPVAFGKYQILETLSLFDDLTYYKAKTLGVAGFEKLLTLCVSSKRLSHQREFASNLIKATSKTVNLAHANISQVYDLGYDEASSQYLLATEYTAGHSLDTILTRGREIGRPLPLDLILFIASEIVKGLDYTHRRKSYDFEDLNIVHGNLHPSNILISFDGGIKISNFGIAQAITATKLAENSHEPRVIKYLAPEVLKTHQFTQSADIYSTGLLFYELLAGESPFDIQRYQSHQDLYQKIITAEIPPLSSLGNFSRKLVKIVESMLVPNPEGRSNDAGSIFEELVGILYSQSIRTESRLLSKYLTEIGLSKHRSHQYTEDYGAELAAISLRPPAGLQRSVPIRAHVKFSPDGDQLPIWISHPLRELVRDTGNSEQVALSQIVLLIDDPEPHTLSATDYWAQLVDQKSKNSSKMFLNGIICIQSLFHTDAITCPATGLCEQLLYPLVRLVDLAEGQPQPLPIGFEKRRYTLEILLKMGLDPDVHQLLYSLWILGFPVVETNIEAIINAISETMRFTFRQTCIATGKSAIVWFASHVERLDALSIRALALIYYTSQTSPVFTILSTDNEVVFTDILANDFNFHENLHTITVDYSPVQASLPQFDDLAAFDKELMLMLSIWDRPISLPELHDLTRIDENTLVSRLNALVSQGWARALQGERWVVLIRETYPHIFDYFSKEDVKKAGLQLQSWFRSHLTPVKSIPNWQPIDFFWPRIHCIAEAPPEMIQSAEFIRNSLGSFGLFSNLSAFYTLLDRAISQYNLKIPHFRNLCLVQGAQLKLYTFDLESAQEQVRLLTFQSDTNKHNSRTITDTLLFNGMFLLFNDDTRRSLHFFEQTIELSNLEPQPRPLAIAYLLSAVAYLRMGEHRRASGLHRACINIQKHYDNHYFEPYDHTLFLFYGVLIYGVQGKYKFAETYLRDMRSIATGAPDPLSYAFYYFAEGFYSFATGDLEAAYMSFERCCSFSEPYVLRFHTVTALLHLTHLSFLKKDYSKARKHLAHIERLASLAAESYVKQLENDFRLLINLVDPIDEIDVSSVHNYLNAVTSRAMKREQENDLKRARFISYFAPKEAVPDILKSIPLPHDLNYIEQLQLFSS